MTNHAEPSWQTALYHAAESAVSFLAEAWGKEFNVMAREIADGDFVFDDFQWECQERLDDYIEGDDEWRLMEYLREFADRSPCPPTAGDINGWRS